ncbi:UDP-N-acetylmuramoyl-L-alanine--D-glutamate ligase [Sandaracinobacter sp. RS1-74]|uniref:UDP-N-acetylmuramoyl-L-alanine--D-glutamate ligase n=1 Tax=Sandaracinobacteroides sayramensis TaxID=2913411 RepID=UPI001EDA39B5|nr:UDP-N-acetylmuramoyl-L-alanine--D-glutamate ligase [Sandaracinobacteroides sayramensis]MCG2840477.1 UDP-N-acetylmuramoyl-L-alanine--D-glutamate ligase [Sandaracinobacteroides sayramensis]
MLAAPSLAGQRFAVYGLARTGLSVLGFLARSGAVAVAWDEAEAARAAAQTAFPDIELQDFATLDLEGLAGLIVSPGVPLNRHPLAARARDAGVPILGDMELFQRARPALPGHKLVAITGTNGKSTTTALIHHLLVSAGRNARLGGNIGLPILDQEPLAEGGIYVLELSSYQIDLCQTLAADVAVYTNLTPDHLDRYDGMQGYAASKARLFAMQKPGAVAVIAIDDEWTSAAAGHLPEGVRLVTVSAASIDGSAQALWPSLQGPHNAQNAALAIAVARALGLSREEVGAGLESFPGLAHRMEIVGTVNGVRYVNDSKATNPTSVAPALQAFEGIHWILGGLAKTDELDACLPHLAHVRAAYAIGEAGPLFASILRPWLPVSLSGTLAAAVAEASAAAKPGETVLLSPACASFDQFQSFEARGEAFRAEVERRAAMERRSAMERPGP